MSETKGHIPVLYEEALQMLHLKPGMTAVDGTLGGAGHAQGIIERVQPGGKLIEIDKDAAAIRRGKERLAEYGNCVTFAHDDYKNITTILEKLEIERIDAALLDLGVSSFQLDEGDRGFSYNIDAPLDMRMDMKHDLDAKVVVNEYSEEALSKIIKEYGEERWAKRIAEFIVKARKEKRIETTGALVSVIKAAVPKGARQDGPHPAKRTFQAIRIEVNGELEALAGAVEDFTGALKSGGRLAVITFHSLEDRIVKQTMKKLYDPCECPKDFPVCACGKESLAKIITKKPVLPAKQEIEGNPRARSAKLRVLEKR